MKLFASILLILSFASMAAAQTSTVAYTVANVQRTADDTYSVSVDDTKVPTNKKIPIPANGTALFIITIGCKHVPGAGENGIVLTGPLGNSLLFGNGETCKIAHTLAK